jgi:hypothetical protein
LEMSRQNQLQSHEIGVVGSRSRKSALQEQLVDGSRVIDRMSRRMKENMVVNKEDPLAKSSSRTHFKINAAKLQHLMADHSKSRKKVGDDSRDSVKNATSDDMKVS